SRRARLSLPTARGPLGHAPEHTGVARGGRRSRAGGTLLAPGLGRRGGDARPLPARRWPPGRPGPPGAPARRLQGALPDHGPLVLAATGPLVGAVSDTPDRLPSSEGAPGRLGRAGRVPAAVRPPGGGVLDRRGLRPNGAVGAGDRFPQRERLVQDDRFRVDRWGRGDLLSPVDGGPGLHRPGGPRQREAPDPRPLSAAAERLPEG